MANTHVVLEGVKDYTLELIGEEYRDVAVDAADRAEARAERAETAAADAAGDAAETAADRVATGEDRAQTGEDREAAEGWASQSKDAATLAITAAATVTQYVGDGFPEGKVTAPVGSIYTDTQATAGAVRWVKTSGTGATGWSVEYGDTGWRNITSLFSAAPDNGTVLAKATPVAVNIYFNYTRWPSGAQVVANLPVDWGPIFTDIALINSASELAGRAELRYDGRLTITPSGTPVLRGVVKFLPPNKFPSTLPGTPA